MTTENPDNPYAPPQSRIEPERRERGAERLASRRTRFIATSIEGLIMMVVLIPLQWVTGYLDRAPDSLFEVNLEEVAWIVFAFLGWVAANWPLLRQGQTIGKRIMGLRIVARDGSPVTAQHIVVRRMLPVSFASSLPFAGGPLAMLDALLIFRAERNTLHDDLAGTKVIEV